MVTEATEGDERTDTTTRRALLRGGAGVAAAALALPAVSGTAAAHFPDELAVNVRPGSDENPINPRSHGVVSVAVLATDSFDPASEDVRYRFGAPDAVASGGGARQVGVEFRDAGDGREDAVLRFRTDETGFDGDDEAGELRWDRDESREHGLSGRDAVRVVGNGRGRGR